MAQGRRSLRLLPEIPPGEHAAEQDRRLRDIFCQRRRGQPVQGSLHEHSYAGVVRGQRPYRSPRWAVGVNWMCGSILRRQPDGCNEHAVYDPVSAAYLSTPEDNLIIRHEGQTKFTMMITNESMIFPTRKRMDFLKRKSPPRQRLASQIALMIDTQFDLCLDNTAFLSHFHMFFLVPPSLTLRCSAYAPLSLLLCPWCNFAFGWKYPRLGSGKGKKIV